MYEKLTLPNGVRIVCERIDYVRSASLGVWVGAGSRHETEADSGASHFIEHMLFKGTATRSTQELAAFMDSVGGQVNAFTSKECTCFHGRVVDTRLRELADALGDMVLRSAFQEQHVQSERNVILEEIDMYEDAPEDVVSERLLQTVLSGALARPILGSRRTLRNMTGQSLREYQQSKYRGGAIVVSLTGSFTDDDLKHIADIFSELPAGGTNTYRRSKYTPGITLTQKSIEQNHICIAFPGISVTDDRRYTLQLLSDILGGGMSSRLFQSVREERGLCYSIYTYTPQYMDLGLISVCTALDSGKERDALALIRDEIARFRDGLAEQDELERLKSQAEASILMALESTSSRMNRLGRNELFFGKILEPDEIIAKYQAITREDIAELARECFDFSRASISVVGRAADEQSYLDILRA